MPDERPRQIASADEIERVGHLEGASGMLAFKIADLIPDIGNDRITLGFDLGPLRGFVHLHREQIVPVGAGSKLGPTFNPA